MNKLAARYAWCVGSALAWYYTVQMLFHFSQHPPGGSRTASALFAALIGGGIIPATLLLPLIWYLAIRGDLPGTGGTRFKYWKCQQCGRNMRSVAGPNCPRCGTPHAIAEQKNR